MRCNASRNLPLLCGVTLCLAAAAPAWAAAPDLSVTGAGSTQPPHVGEPVRFVASVRNGGDAPTPLATTVGVLFLIDGFDGFTTYSGNDATPLQAGQTRNYIASGGVPGAPDGSWTPTVAGRYRVTAIVDDVNRIAESNETNNRYSFDFDVPAAGNRPRIVGGTLRTASGQLLRGGDYWLQKNTQQFDWALVESNLGYFSQYDLNALRLSVMDDIRNPQAYDIEERIAQMDKFVQWTRARGLVLMIEYHNVEAGLYDRAKALAFWRRVAPRYKDEPHVVYELMNEPGNGGETASRTPEFEPKTWSDYDIESQKVLFDAVRAAAPQTPIAMFSFALIRNFDDSTQRDGVAVVDAFNRRYGFDWSKANAVVSAHAYFSTTTRDYERMKAIAPVMAGEGIASPICYYDGCHDPVDGHLWMQQAFELKQMSWFDWQLTSDRDTGKNLEALKRDAQAKGYWWGR
ncbi:MAG: cellulase family glycosylhydrolase [Lysobacter sp.]